MKMDHFQHLTPHQQRTVQAIGDWFASLPPDPVLPRGFSLSKYLNQFDPEVRDAVMHTIRVVDYTESGGKHMPFQEAIPTSWAAKEIGADERVLKGVYQRAAQEEIEAGLQAKMGTDADRPLEPLTPRDYVSAAVDACVPEDHWDK